MEKTLERHAILRAGRNGSTEKPRDEPKLPEAETIATATGTISAVALLLAALALRAGTFARELGALIGQAAAAVVRSVFGALGGFLAR